MSSSSDSSSLTNADSTQSDGLISTFCLQHPNLFPCDASVIVAVSMGIGAGVLSLIFVVWLYYQVKLLLHREGMSLHC
jgi:hypothetical protein